MGAAKDMWMAHNELIMDQFNDCELTREEAEKQLKGQGLDPDDYVDALDEIEDMHAGAFVQSVLTALDGLKWVSPERLKYVDTEEIFQAVAEIQSRKYKG